MKYILSYTYLKRFKNFIVRSAPYVIIERSTLNKTYTTHNFYTLIIDFETVAIQIAAVLFRSLREIKFDKRPPLIAFNT